LADEFAGLIRKRPGGDLANWLANGESSACPELRQFAAGVRGDESAVIGAVSERFEQWHCRGACEPAEGDKASDVWQSRLLAVTSTGPSGRMSQTTKAAPRRLSNA